MQQAVDELAHALAAIDDVAEERLALVVQHLAVVLDERAAEPRHRAQRRAQVVGHRVRERLELAVGGRELGGAILDALLELGVELTKRFFREHPLGHVLGRAQHPDRRARLGMPKEPRLGAHVAHVAPLLDDAELVLEDVRALGHRARDQVPVLFVAVGEDQREARHHLAWLVAEDAKVLIRPVVGLDGHPVLVEADRPAPDLPEALRVGHVVGRLEPEAIGLARVRHVERDADRAGERTAAVVRRNDHRLQEPALVLALVAEALALQHP